MVLKVWILGYLSIMKIKKIKNENELVKEAIRVGVRYLEARRAGQFEATDHADTKVRAIYLLLVKDGLLQPLADKDVDIKNLASGLDLGEVSFS